MSIYPSQIRAVDPFASFSSNIVNTLTRIISNNSNVILPSSPIEVTKLTDTTLRCSSGKVIKDDVYIETSQHDIDMSDSDFYLDAGTGPLDSTGYYYIVLQYTYVKTKPAPQASLRLIKPDQRLSLFGNAHLLLKVIYVNASLEIDTLFDYDPENPTIRRKFGNPKTVGITNIDGNYTAIAGSDDVLVSQGNNIVTLPPATSKVQLGMFKSDTGTTLTILPDGTDTIGGGSSFEMTVQYDAAIFIADGNETWYVIKGDEAIGSQITELTNDINDLQYSDSTSNIRIDNLETDVTNITNDILDLQYSDSTSDVKIENLESLTNNEEIAKNYIRTNQSFTNMVYDDFTTLDKTNSSYYSKVDIDSYTMTPGNGGEWRSIVFTSSGSITVCKMDWRQDSTFDHDIDISADNGSNWTNISTSGSQTYMDQEITISNSGTQVIIKISGGTLGNLKNYILLVK